MSYYLHLLDEYSVGSSDVVLDDQYVHQMVISIHSLHQ
jgi:hypothetical protein